MSIYSVDKLISEARKLAADYRKTTGKSLGGVSGEIALNDAARLLDLELCDSNVGGYDAIGRGRLKGKKIQIKGRVIFDEGKSTQRIGQLKIDQDWDSVVLVLMNECYEPVEIYELDREAIMDDLAESDSKRKKRGAMSVAKFKIIGSLVWSESEGMVDDQT